MENEAITPEAASAAARALRLVNSPAQQEAAKNNGKLGGRPKGKPMSEEHKAKLRAAALERSAARATLTGPKPENPEPARPRGRPRKTQVETDAE